MIRDFTEEAKNLIEDAMIDSLNNRVSYSGRAGSYEEVLEETVTIMGQDCLINFSDIESEAEAIAQRSRHTKTVQGEMVKLLSEIFENARTADADTSTELADDVNEVSSLYKKNLKAFVDSIAVGWMGSSKESIRYNMGRYHSSYETSIFSSGEGFQNKIDGIDGGIVQSIYNDIKDVEGEAFQSLIDKPLEEVEAWEVAALAMVFEDCVDENGNIDCEKLENLVNHCYIIEYECNFTGPMSGYMHEYDIHPSPVFTLLDDYLSSKSSQMASAYENSDLRIQYDISLKDVQASCYLADVVYAANTFYPEHEHQHLELYTGEGDPNHPITLEMSGDGTTITMDFFGMEDDATIYRFTDDFMQELFDANSVAASSGLKDPEKQLFLDCANFLFGEATGAVVDKIAEHTPVIGTFYTIYGLGSDVYGIYNSYNENVDNNESIYHAMDNQELLKVMYATNCSTSLIQCGDRIDIRNVAFDYTDVICQTALYNQAIDGDYPNADRPIEGEKIDSYLTVQQEFNQYMTGEKTLEECPSLNALISFDRGNAVFEEGSYSHYRADVETALESYLGISNIDPCDVHLNELEEVVDSAAVSWLEYENEKAGESDD